jgi:hypothetical protein
MLPDGNSAVGKAALAALNPAQVGSRMKVLDDSV